MQHVELRFFYFFFSTTTFKLFLEILRDGATQSSARSSSGRKMKWLKKTKKCGMLRCLILFNQISVNKNRHAS